MNLAGSAINGYFGMEYQADPSEPVRGYHKPVMIAGSNIRDAHVHAAGFPEGTALVVLGGPAMLIGLGGGAASSMASGSSATDLDFVGCSVAIQKWRDAVRKLLISAVPLMRPTPFY